MSTYLLVLAALVSNIVATPAAAVAPTSTICTATAFSQISAAVASCTNIVLSNIAMPANETINLLNLKTGTTVTFDGLTTFAFTNSSTFNPITINHGTGVTIQGAPGSVINGNGQAYWDGQGSNGGVPKPDHMLDVSNLLGGSIIKDLYIEDYPVHCFSISNSADLTIQNIVVNNTAGNAPNAISSGLPAAHNSDGFDISTCDTCLLQNSQVYNQDDCVAITSGNNITVENMYCVGSHGLSIGSVGGKSNNNVTNILFNNCECIGCQNGARIKTNSGTTGFISNVTYTNIYVEQVSVYGIDVQQDYLNGGPTGIPTNGVIIENILFENVTGTANISAQDYYVLCGSGSCSNIDFVDCNVVGGENASSCNFPPSGCPISVPVYGQCGGIGYTGSTTCTCGSACAFSNPYYSQCLPVEQSSDTSVPDYGQCGGLDYTGLTVCTCGSTCVYSNPYYSQCLLI